MSKRVHPLDPAECERAVQVCACLNFRKAARSVTQLFDGILQPSGLRSTQFVVLVAVRAAEPAPLPDLARELQLDRSTLTRNLKPLARAGLLRIEDKAGERARFARLTAKGHRLLADTLPLWQEAQDRFLAQVGKRNWRELRGILTDVVTAAEDA